VVLHLDAFSLCSLGCLASDCRVATFNALDKVGEVLSQLLILFL